MNFIEIIWFLWWSELTVYKGQGYNLQMMLPKGKIGSEEFSEAPSES